MKKQLMVLLCALTLLTVTPASAQTNYAAACGATTVLNVAYDENAFELDTESYLASSRGSHTWLGIFYNGSYTVELAADRCGDLPADSDLNQLADYLCGALAQEQCQKIDTYGAFAIFSLSGPTGNSYYAATLSHGYVVHFEIYNMRGGVDASALSTLKKLLNGVSK